MHTSVGAVLYTDWNNAGGRRQVKQADELENILAKKFLRFLSMRAESFQVLRRKPVQVEYHYFEPS